MAVLPAGACNETGLRVVAVVTRLIFDPVAEFEPGQRAIVDLLARQLRVAPAERQTLGLLLRGLSPNDLLTQVEAVCTALSHSTTRVSPRH